MRIFCSYSTSPVAFPSVRTPHKYVQKTAEIERTVHSFSLDGFTPQPIVHGDLTCVCCYTFLICFPTEQGIEQRAPRR